MSHDTKLFEQIDACRPGSDDLAAPELAALAERLAVDEHARQVYDRLQQLDAAIGAALHDIPVPEGLAERLLATLAAAQVSGPAEAVPASPVEENERAADERRVGRDRSRQRWFWGAGALAVAAAVLIGLFLPDFVVPPDRPDGQLLVEQTIQFDQQRRDKYQSLAVTSPPPEYAVSRAVRFVPRRADWRYIDDFLGYPGWNAVAYRFQSPTGETATLYVAPHPSAALPQSPPSTPRRYSQGIVAAAWQENGLAYVLVVRGGEAAYQSFVHRPTLT